MKSYLEKITPNVADVWRADELYMKVKGNPKYLFALIDDQTRFWIAQQVADNKYTSNIRPLFAHAKEITHKRPNTMNKLMVHRIFMILLQRNFLLNQIPELDIFRTYAYREITITTKWKE